MYFNVQLCEFMFELAQRFNQFYESCPVLQAETAELRASRAALCALTAGTCVLACCCIEYLLFFPVIYRIVLYCTFGAAFAVVCSSFLTPNVVFLLLQTR